MKNRYYTPALLAISIALSACSTTPTNTSLLEQTRSDYIAAQTSQTVSKYAQLEMKQASEAMGRANSAADKKESPDEVDKLAYIAKQKIALTQEVAKQKAAEAEVASSGRERDQMRLQQRTMEADRERASAQLSNMSATIAQNNAAEAQRKADMARDEAAEAQRRTQDAQARAAELEAQLAELAAKKTDRGTVITLGDVLFGVDKSDLNPQGARTAQKLAEILQKNPERTILIEGYTDSTGSRSHNQALSERRANTVRALLEQNGVAANRITTRGYADANPVASNKTAQDRQLNRRVEIILSDENGKVSQR